MKAVSKVCFVTNGHPCLGNQNRLASVYTYIPTVSPLCTLFLSHRAMDIVEMNCSEAVSTMTADRVVCSNYINTLLLSWL